MIVSLFDRLKLRPRRAAAPSSGRTARTEPVRDDRERPGQWVADNELADALARKGNIADAVAHLCALGDRLAAEGFLPRAHAIYKKALRLQPDHAHAALRAAELGLERINQTGSRLPTRSDEPAPLDDVSALPAASADVPAAPEDVPAEPVDLPVVSALPPADIAEPGPDPEPAAGGSEDPRLQPEAEQIVTPKSVAEILQDATVTAAYGDVDAAVRALTDCALAHPDLIEPVTTLVEIAGRNGLEGVLDNAEARLCELYCRRDDYAAARQVAAALVARHPDDARHRARLSFVETAIDERQDGYEAVAPAEPPPPSDDAVMGDAVASDAVTIDAVAPDAGVASEPHPFDACRERARVDAADGNWVSALAWLEQAAASIPDSTAETELAYDIALVFEGAGDRQRAIGILSEIAAKAGADYRDVAERIRRLTAPADAAHALQLS